MKTREKVAITIVIILAVAFIISVATLDDRRWNDGICPDCGEGWELVKEIPSHGANESAEIWRCPNCHKTICLGASQSAKTYLSIIRVIVIVFATTFIYRKIKENRRNKKMKNKKNEWRKIPFRNLIDKIEEKQVRTDDPHKITRQENKNFFSVHWYDKYDNEIVVLTKSGKKMLKKAMQPFLAEKIKFVDIDHDEHGKIYAIKIKTQNHIYTYNSDRENILINKWFELYRCAKQYNFKLFLRKEIENLKLNEEKTIIVDREYFRSFLETENLTLEELEEKPIFTNEELSLDSFKLKYINYIPENNDYVFAFQDTIYPKDDWDEDSFLYLRLNSEGKIMKRSRAENSLLIKLS